MKDANTKDQETGQEEDTAFYVLEGNAGLEEKAKEFVRMMERWCLCACVCVHVCAYL